MNFSSIFSQSWKEYKSNFKPILLFMLIFIAVPTIILSIVSISMVLSNDGLRTLALSGSPTSPEISLQNLSFILTAVVIAIISMLLMIFFQGGLVSLSLRKKTFGFGELFNSSKKSFWKYLAFSIVFFIFIFLLFLLLIIPGIIFMIYWIFGIYILFDQKKGILESLKSSRKLVRGRWWRVLGYSILIVLIYLAVSIVASIVFSIPLIPYYIAGGFGALATGPISAGQFIVGQLSKTLTQIATSIVMVPLSAFFFKNFYLALKKSKN